MSSQIAAIYSTLAAKTITVDGVDIPGKTGADIPNSAATTPVRVLSSLSGYLFENVTEALLWMTGTGGQVKQMRWQIADLMLWRSVGAGRGPKDFELNLLAYIAAYADMLANDTELSTVGCVSVAPMWANGIYEYPPESGQFYYGSLVNLTITEKWS